MTQELRDNIIEKLEEEFGDTMSFDDNDIRDSFVDDGSVHIRRNGVRFVVDFDQQRFGDRLAEKNIERVSGFVDNLINNNK